MERVLLILGRITSLYVVSKPIINPPNNQPFGDPFTSSQDTHVLNNKAWCCRCLIFLISTSIPLLREGRPTKQIPFSLDDFNQLPHLSPWKYRHWWVTPFSWSIISTCKNGSQDFSRIHAPVIDKIEIHLTLVISCYIKHQKLSDEIHPITIVLINHIHHKPQASATPPKNTSVGFVSLSHHVPVPPSVIS